MSKIIPINKINQLCPICLHQLNLFKIYTIINCNHKFHYKCIKMSFHTNTNKQKNCPYCRLYNGSLKNDKKTTTEMNSLNVKQSLDPSTIKSGYDNSIEKENKIKVWNRNKELHSDDP